MCSRSRKCEKEVCGQSRVNEGYVGDEVGKVEKGQIIQGLVGHATAF